MFKIKSNKRKCYAEVYTISVCHDLLPTALKEYLDSKGVIQVVPPLKNKIKVNVKLKLYVNKIIIITFKGRKITLA